MKPESDSPEEAGSDAGVAAMPGNPAFQRAVETLRGEAPLAPEERENSGAPREAGDVLEDRPGSAAGPKSRLGLFPEPKKTARRAARPAKDSQGELIFEQALENLRREMPTPPRPVVKPVTTPGTSGEPLVPLAPEPAALPEEDQRRSAETPLLKPPAPETAVIPARMLNEFVYCPRLFYYEFVESVFVESADTVRGKAIHRRVDSGKGDLPPAAQRKTTGRAELQPKAGRPEPPASALSASPRELMGDGFAHGRFQSWPVKAEQ